MISIQPSSKAFSLPLSSLIFLMYGAQLFIPAPLKTSGFSSWDTSIVFYFSSSPPWSLHLFPTFICLFFFLYLPGHFSFNRSLIITIVLVSSCFLFLFYTDSFVFLKLYRWKTYRYALSLIHFFVQFWVLHIKTQICSFNIEWMQYIQISFSLSQVLTTSSKVTSSESLTWSLFLKFSAPFNCLRFLCSVCHYSYHGVHLFVWHWDAPQKYRLHEGKNFFALFTAI